MKKLSIIFILILFAFCGKQIVKVSPQIESGCKHIDSYYSVSIKDLDRIKEFNKKYNLIDSNSVIFYQFPSFEGNQISILKIGTDTIKTLLMEHKADTMTKITGTVYTDSIYTDNLLELILASNKSETTTNEMATLFTDTLNLENLLELKSVKLACLSQKGDTTAIYFLDGTNYSIFINWKGKSNFIQFDDSKYQNGIYSELINLFDKYMFINQNSLRTLINKRHIKY